MTTYYTSLDKHDLQELFRIHDFSKKNHIDDFVSLQVAENTPPAKCFTRLFALYRIKCFPDRAKVRHRIKAAVPQATPEEIESAIRLAEMRGFGETDALMTLKRKYPSVASVPSRRKNKLTDASEVGRGAPNLLQSGAANLRSIGNVHVPRERLHSSSPLLRSDGSHVNAVQTGQKVDVTMSEGIRKWVAKVIGDKYNAEVLSSPNFVDSLRSGVVLHILLQKIRTPPIPEDKIIIPSRTTGFFARDNVSAFLRMAQEQLCLSELHLFTETDLCDGKDDRRVVSCLMNIERMTCKNGVIKPLRSLAVLEDVNVHASKLAVNEGCLVQEDEEGHQKDPNTLINMLAVQAGNSPGPLLRANPSETRLNAEVVREVLPLTADVVEDSNPLPPSTTVTSE